MESNEKVVFIHGFSREETMTVMRAVKAAVQDPGEIAFTMSTAANIEWKVKDLIKDVREEHEYMKKNPPGNTGSTK